MSECCLHLSHRQTGNRTSLASVAQVDPQTLSRAEQEKSPISREHDDAVVAQASADKTSHSGLTFQLSEDPVASDPAAHSSTFWSMSDLVPRMVEMEKQVVSSSEAIASSKSSKESLRLTIQGFSSQSNVKLAVTGGRIEAKKSFVVGRSRGSSSVQTVYYIIEKR